MVLVRGNQLLTLQYKPTGLRVIDSYLHIPLRLSALNEAFGLDMEDKGSPPPPTRRPFSLFASNGNYL